MDFSHNKKEFEKQIQNKNNFILFKEIKKFDFDPIPEFLNLVE